MTNFFQRIITGTILILAIVCCILISQFTFAALVFLINIMGLWEFYGLFKQYHPLKIPGLVLSAFIYLSCILFFFDYLNWKILLINVPIAFGLFVAELFSRSENPFQKLAFTFLGIVYITIPCLFLTALSSTPFPKLNYQPHLLIGYFIIIWSSDSSAYAFGKMLGRHALFERISPKKTWEGSLGGIIGVAIAAFILSNFFTEIRRADWFVIAIIVTLFGTTGDLIKSMLKRSLNVKDSGKILPGHGGILDRFDSLMSSTPFVFSYLALNNH